jgi:hypothetical protein
VREQLPALYGTEGERDPMVICKFFHPLSNWTWYCIEGSPVDEDGFCDTDKPKIDFLFFVWVHSDFPELGYFSLSLMQAAKIMGLGIERDIDFEPTRLSVVKGWHRRRA